MHITGILLKETCIYVKHPIAAVEHSGSLMVRSRFVAGDSVFEKLYGCYQVQTWPFGLSILQDDESHLQIFKEHKISSVR